MSQTGGEILVESLIKHGVNDLFMIPGIQLDWVVDALRKRNSEVNLYVPRHEQTTTYMADGYYRVTGKPGVAMVVPGPGALNAGAGLATAYASNSNIMFITPQIFSTAMGKGYGLLHEIKDQSGFVKGLTKWHKLVKSTEDISPVFDSAFNALLSGRPRPVGIEIPHDYLESQTFLSVATEIEDKQAKSTIELHTIEQAVKILNEANLPVIYIGGGVVTSDAGQEVQDLAEKIGAPIVMSDNGRGAISDRHPMAMNTLAGRAVFQHADVALIVGSRFMDTLTPTPSWPQSDKIFIYINIDAEDLTHPREPDVAIISDAAEALTALTSLVNAKVAMSKNTAKSVKEWAQRQIDAITPQSEYIKEMRKALPEDGIFVNELTQVGYLSRIAFPVYESRTYIGPGYQGTLGYGFPLSLGAAIGAKGKRVLSITGDGGFGWNMQELATAVRYRLRVTLVVFNDGYFGNVRAIQKRVFGADMAVELTNPDFQVLALAFGVPSMRVNTPKALGGAIQDSLQEDGPVLIEVNVNEMSSPWPLLRLQPMQGVDIPETQPNPLD